jgi:hypothetical protein
MTMPCPFVPGRLYTYDEGFGTFTIFFVKLLKNYHGGWNVMYIDISCHQGATGDKVEIGDFSIFGVDDGKWVDTETGEVVRFTSGTF